MSTVDSEIFHRSADRYHSAYERIRTESAALTRALDENSDCAGTDPAGRTWSDKYDPAARAAVRSIADLVNSYGRLHDLLAATAVTHANAENAAREPPLPPESPPRRLDEFTAGQPRQAAGGQQPPPLGWSAIASFAVDLVWPNGDPDKLRALSDAWRDTAEKIRATSDALGLDWTELEAQDSPEMPQVLAQLDIVFTFGEDLALSLDVLSDSCRDWAWDIEQAHRDIEKILAEAIAAAVIVGAITAVVTAGFATAAVESGVAGATVVSIGAVLLTLDGAAITASAAAAGVGVAVVGAAKHVQPLLDAQPTVFEAVPTGRGRTLQYHRAPTSLPGFPDARLVKQLGNRKRWIDKRGRIYEWDHQHGAVEMYGNNGKHLGEFDPETGAQLKPADPTRRIAR